MARREDDFFSRRPQAGPGKQHAAFTGDEVSPVPACGAGCVYVLVLARRLKRCPMQSKLTMQLQPCSQEQCLMRPPGWPSLSRSSLGLHLLQQQSWFVKPASSSAAGIQLLSSSLAASCRTCWLVLRTWVSATICLATGSRQILRLRQQRQMETSRCPRPSLRGSLCPTASRWTPLPPWRRTPGTGQFFIQAYTTRAAHGFCQDTGQRRTCQCCHPSS